MEEVYVEYKDLKCMLVKENSKKYLMIEEQENLTRENLEEKVKEYGFKKEDNVWKLEVWNCFNDYQIDEEYNMFRGESVGKYILSDSEVIYAFQQEMHFSRYWQITYEEYINYKNWENDETFIRKIVDKRPYLDTYFSRNDLFKIIIEDKDENGKCKGYCLEYLKQPDIIIEVKIYEEKAEENLLKFQQEEMINFAKVDIDKEEWGLPFGFYNGYQCLHCTPRELIDMGSTDKYYAFYEWNKHRKIVEFKLPKNCSIEEKRNAIKSAILKIDKIDLINKIDKAIIIAEEHINNNFNVGFMNTMIKKYELTKEQLNETGEIDEQAIGGSRAYLYNCFRGELSDSENKLLKAMDLVDEQIQRLIDNKQKYNVI